MEAAPKFLAIPEASHACRHSKALRSRGPSMRQQRLTGDVAAGLSARLLPAGAVRGAQQRCRRAGLGRSGALRHRLRRLRSPERRGGAMCRATDPSRPGAALCRWARGCAGRSVPGEGKALLSRAARALRLTACGRCVWSSVPASLRPY